MDWAISFLQTIRVPCNLEGSALMEEETPGGSPWDDTPRRWPPAGQGDNTHLNLTMLRSNLELTASGSVGRDIFIYNIKIP